MTAGSPGDPIFERARALGFLGPGEVETHVLHAGGFAAVVEAVLGRPPATLADLGTGGGVPGLVLAARWPECRVSLLESIGRRADHLRQAVAERGWDDRVEVIEDRAERVAHRPARREGYEAVTARAFAAPAPTAEIAAGLVEPGGILVVSEPPEPAPERWPPERLAELGFGPAEPRTAAAAHFVVLAKRSPAPPGVPRAVGRPAKRPRW